MGLRDEQAAFLLDACRLIAHATREGFQVTGGELFRTMEQQRIYVETGRSLTMNSRHGDRRALDLNFFKGGEVVADYDSLLPLGQFWEGLTPGKNKWGGNFKRADGRPFKDLGHFERRS